MSKKIVFEHEGVLWDCHKLSFRTGYGRSWCVEQLHALNEGKITIDKVLKQTKNLSSKLNIVFKGKKRSYGIEDIMKIRGVTRITAVRNLRRAIAGKMTEKELNTPKKTAYEDTIEVEKLTQEQRDTLEEMRVMNAKCAATQDKYFKPI